MKETRRQTEAAGGGEVATSVAAMLGNQHLSGSFVACPDFPQYRYCWLRDGAFTAYALDRAGEAEAAERFHRWCGRAILGVGGVMAEAVARQATGRPVDASAMPPARFSLDGAVVKDDWPNFQVDGYGTWLWSLEQHLRMAGGRALPSRLAPAVELTASYLAAFGTSPCFDVWEESGGSVHTATLACVYGGLVAGSHMLDDAGLAARAASVRATVLGQGRRDGYFRKSDHSEEVDGALLWLCEPFHMVPPGERAFVETVRRISTELDLDGGIRRYPADTYYGGGAWPVLTASLGWYYAISGNLGAAQQRSDWITERIDDQGRLAEQFGGERRDPKSYGEWVGRWGAPAPDLVWSHAMYVVLALAREARETAPESTNAGDRPAPDQINPSEERNTK